LKVKITIILLALLLVLSGCSARPKDGTVILNEHPSSLNQGEQFQLENIVFYDISSGKTLIGWHGNNLVLYDTSGIYLQDSQDLSLSLLFAPEGGKLSSAVLSNNFQKVFYTVATASGVEAYLSAADGRANAVKITDINAAKGINYLSVVRQATWSDNGKYINVGGKAFPLLAGIYDTSTGNSALSAKTIAADTGLSGFIFDIADRQGKVLGLLSQPGSHGLYVIGFNGQMTAKVNTANDDLSPSKASFISDNEIVYLAGNTLNLENIAQKNASSEASQVYNNVSYYALSADRKLICYVKNRGAGTSDIYVGTLRGNAIVNETLIYMGLTPSPNQIFFSADNKKIVISGYQKDENRIQIMIVNFN
jgi:hypothetical protein